MTHHAIRADPSWEGRSFSPSRLRLIIFYFALFLLSAPVAYYHLFTVFFEYDDEGYLMIAAKYVLAGYIPYEQVPIQYGPVWLLYQWLFHGWLGIPISHEAARLIFLAIWLATSVLCSLFVLRVTRSTLLAGSAYILVFLHLERLTAEPGHPQEVCAILLAISLLLSTFLGSSRGELLTIAALGVVTAATILAKINLGIFLFISLSLVLLLASSRRPVFTVGYVVLAGVALLLPVWLMKSRMAEGLGIPYCTVATLSMLPVLHRSVRLGPFGSFQIREHLTFLASIVGTIMTICTLGWSRGLSLSTLYYGVVGQHRQFADAFYMSVGMPPAAGDFAIIAVLAYFLLLRWIDPSRSQEQSAQILSWLKIAFGILVLGVAISAYWTEARIALMFPLQFRGHSNLLLAYATPFLWLVLVPTGTPELSLEQYLGRLTLCFVAALQTLQAFPVAGSQMVLATLPILIIAVICLYDGINTVPQLHLPDLSPAKIRSGSLTLLFLLSLTVLLYRGKSSYERFQHRVSLQLPGAERLMLPRAMAETYRRLALNLQSNCDTFLALPSMNSFYFWTQMPPPTSFNPPWWPRMLEQGQQQAIVTSLEAHERACFVYDTRLGELKNDLDRGPLLSYIQQSFHGAGSIGPFELRIRNERQNLVVLQ